MVVDIYPAIPVHCRGASVEHPVIRLPSVVESHIADTVPSHSELLSFVQGDRQGIAAGVRRMGYIPTETGLRGETGLPSYRIVIQCHHPYGIVHPGGSVPGGTDDVSEDIVDICIVVSPLHPADSVAVLQSFQCEFQIFAFLFKTDDGYRTVSVFQPVPPAGICGLLRVVVPSLPAVIEAQQRRRAVGRAEIAALARGVPHPDYITFRINVDSETVRAESTRTSRAAAAQEADHSGTNDYPGFHVVIN